MFKNWISCRKVRIVLSSIQETGWGRGREVGGGGKKEEGFQYTVARINSLNKIYWKCKDRTCKGGIIAYTITN